MSRENAETVGGMRAETIFAIASGAGRAAIAVVRISGPATRDIVKTIAGRVPAPRVATLATLRDGATGEALDQGIAMFFPAPRSFTGEDCAEFHIHGGRAVVSALIAAIGRLNGVRAAEPGEFTRRALLNGKMDLAQVEGLADLIDAETEWQRRQALRQMKGRLSQQAAIWRKALLEASALVEAEIDFSDEGDVPEATSRRVRSLLRPVRDGLRSELNASRSGERIRDGLVIVIAGPPNAGKSTLLNALARRDVAIVSKEAGTTRDALEVHLDLSGCPVTLIDTAGLRESADAVEQIGVARALQKAQHADLILWLSEADRPVAPDKRVGTSVIWPILTKCDLSPTDTPAREGEIYLSAETGQNMGVLLQKLADFASSITGDGYGGLITQERHRQSFNAAAAALTRILDNLDSPVEIIAEDLRAALFALQRLTGLVDVEDILGEIFSRFCIGK
ncbi:MAG: tRNA uridine-5-carboxymethylaminomethyl(34) synthesis GTPase MnmE [Methylocella sp.]